MDVVALDRIQEKRIWRAFETRKRVVANMGATEK